MVVMTEENPEVRRARRWWPARYKLDVLEEIDQAKLTGEPGAVGEILRREDLYSSLITEWRKQRDAGALRGLTDTNAGGNPRTPPGQRWPVSGLRSPGWGTSSTPPTSSSRPREKYRRCWRRCPARAPNRTRTSREPGDRRMVTTGRYRPGLLGVRCPPSDMAAPPPESSRHPAGSAIASQTRR